jgi:hypothetical protein
MLVNHINQMKDKYDWGQHEYVFKLVITDIKQNNEKNSDSSDDEIQTETNGDFDSSYDENNLTSVVSSVISSSITRRSPPSKKNQPNNQKSPFKSMMEELFIGLPKYYIHIPNDFHISINEKRVFFNFWQKRMVHMMRFDQLISKNIHYQEEDDDIKHSPSNNTMKVRIFCGFDAIRVTNEKEQKSTSMYIYSRKSGRLIKHEADARNMLKITAGGTAYCQGLTCLVDDFDGNIPLNPTKQDVAFSEMKNGDIFKENLYAGISANVAVYYRYHLDRKYDGRKEGLTEELKDLAKQVKKKFIEHSPRSRDCGYSLKSLADADFLTLSNLSYEKKPNKILAKLSSKVGEAGSGADTLFKLRGRKKSPKTLSTKTKKRVQRNESFQISEIYPDQNQF